MIVMLVLICNRKGTIVMNKRERVIDYIFKQKYDNNNKYKFTRENYTLKKVTEEEFVVELKYLEKEGLIRIDYSGKGTSDLTNWKEVELLVNPNKYKISKKKERSREIREIITLIIAILGLLLSIISIFLQYF